MAFPTSPSNNQVHKEGNRSFVFDSATSVWDRIRETDNSKVDFTAGTIGSDVVFPEGHVVQVAYKRNTSGDSGVETTWINTGINMTITPKLAASKIHLCGELICVMTNQAGNGGFSLRWNRAQSGQTTVFPEGLDNPQINRITDTPYATHWNQASWTAAEFNWRHPISGMDETPHTAGAVITYTLHRKCYSLNGLTLGLGYHGTSNFFAYEIAT